MAFLLDSVILLQERKKQTNPKVQSVFYQHIIFTPSITTFLQNYQEGNLFAESPPLDGLRQAYFMELDGVQSDKNVCSCCPEQRVDAATDIVRQTFISFRLNGFMYHDFS